MLQSLHSTGKYSYVLHLPVHQLSMVILPAIPMSAQMVTQQLQMNGKRHKEAEVLYQITFSSFFSQHNTNETILFSYTNNY